MLHSHAILLLGWLLLGACTPPPTSSVVDAAPETAAAASTSTSVDASSTVSGFEKQAFADAGAALTALLERGKPRIVAFGEMHMPRGATVASSAVRFQKELLPLLAPRASAIVVEAWQPAGCGAKVEAKVAATNRDITKNQAADNPNEYLALANAAKERGLVPLPLRPTCDETARVADAGANDVTTLLEMVTLVAQRTLHNALERTPDRLVLFYGGALHNDLEPSPARASWSFGPALDAETGGAFVEVDLIVPEIIQRSELWDNLPWRSAYDVERDGASVQLLWKGPRRYVLVFARTEGQDAGAPK